MRGLALGVLALGLVLGISHFHGRQVINPDSFYRPTYAEQLRAYYASFKHGEDHADLDIVDLTARYTEEAAVKLCVEDQVDTMLTQWKCESNFQPTADDSHLVGHKKRSLGVTQTREKYIQRLRKQWRKLGIKLGPFGDIRTQVYLGVMEFREHLEQAGGDVREAVRRYNGGGRGGKGLVKAEKYAAKVMKTRAKIFGRPYRSGEKTTLYQSCP